MSIIAAEDGKDHTKCLECDEVYEALSADQILSLYTSSTGRRGSVNTTGTNREQQDIIDKWVDGDGKMILSTKTLAVKCQILEWLKANRNVKIIVYTQFLGV